MTTQDPPRPFGAKVKPFDVKELRYAYRPPARFVNWNEPAMIPKKQRSLVEDQGAMGSCVACAVTSALETAGNLRGVPVPPLSRMLTYFLGREMRGWADRNDRTKCIDSGMYLSDGCDVSLGGMAKESLWPYTPNWSDPPPPGIEADMPNQDPLAAHRPIYPGPGAADAMYAALAEGKPLIIGWIVTGEMYDPGGQPYREGLRPEPSGQHGYHCSWVYGAKQRDTKKRFYGRNSWDTWWNAGIEDWDEDCDPGDFVFPAEWVERSDSMVFEIRVIDAEAFVPNPEPEPEPEPKPEPTDGYLVARQQDLTLLDESIDWYTDDDPNPFAVELCRWHLDVMAGFQPPALAARQRPRPTQRGSP